MKSHIGHTDESPISIFTKLTQNQKKTYSTCKIHHEMHDRDIKEGNQDPDTFWIRGVKN